MINLNVYQAKAKLSYLINAALEGHDVFISKSGSPKVKLVATDSVSQTPPNLLSLSNLKIKGGPKDLSQKLDQYLYENK